ncbi:MAG: hypothetical protein ACREH8_12080 [Opitutaceae bacterium]
MSNPRQRPVTHPQRFISSVFDLAYGARDGSEPLTTAEIKTHLREAGLDPDAAWKEFSVLLQPQLKRETLAAVRKARLADAPPVPATHPPRSRVSILDELNRLLATLTPQTGAVFGRKWEDSTDEDLAAVCSQLRRQIERNKADESRR